MGETTLEIVAIEFLEFIFGLAGKLLATFVWWWVAYVLVRFLLQNIVYKNDSDGWKKFATNVRAGFEEFSIAFCNTMKGAASVAVRWADEKKEEKKRRKHPNTTIDEEHYW